MRRTAAGILAHPLDAYSVALVLAMVGMMAYPYFRPLPWHVAIPWIVLAGFVNIGVNLVNHNHTHCRTFRVGWMNRILEYLLTLTRGSSATFIAMIHNMNHHRHEGKDEDWFSCDNQGTGPRPLRPFVYVFRTVRRFRQGMNQLKIPPRVRRHIIHERIVLNATLAALLWIDWKTTLLFVLLPLVGGNSYVVLTNLLHHDGATQGASEENSFTYLNPVENLLYLNGGYHAMHHWKPGLHWTQLKAAHAVHIAPHARPELTRGSMFYHLFTDYFLRLRDSATL